MFCATSPNVGRHYVYKDSCVFGAHAYRAPSFLRTAHFRSNRLCELAVRHNNYAFDSGTTTGHYLIDQLNLIPDVSPDLTYANTVTAVVTALGQAKTYLDGQGTPSEDYVDYLAAMVAITNPAYFDASHYTGFGATAPSSGYPALHDASARALLPAVTDVDNLAGGSAPIVFASTAAP